jgi:hypothetical protein
MIDELKREIWQSGENLGEFSLIIQKKQINPYSPNFPYLTQSARAPPVRAEASGRAFNPSAGLGA